MERMWGEKPKSNTFAWNTEPKRTPTPTPTPSYTPTPLAKKVEKKPLPPTTKSSASTMNTKPINTGSRTPTRPVKTPSHAHRTPPPHSHN